MTTFTPQQHVVARLLAKGLRNKQIGEHMHIKEGTVKNMLRDMYDKSGMSSRLELALWYIHHFEEGGKCTSRGT